MKKPGAFAPGLSLIAALCLHPAVLLLLTAALCLLLSAYFLLYSCC